ncbi:MAG: porin family protein [Bacteroidota bacterium]
MVSSFITGAFAQDESAPSSGAFTFGARAGFVTSTFSHEQPAMGYKIGFTVAAIVNYGISDKFSVQAEPAYLHSVFTRYYDDTRFGDTSPFANYSTTDNITLHNIDLPVLAKYYLPKLGEFQPNIVLGPAVSYTINADDHFTKTYNLQQVFSSATGYKFVTSEYEKFSVGATAGIGGEVSLGGKRLLIDLRYRYGITPVKKGFSYIDLSGVQKDLRTHSIYFSLGIGI